MLTTVLRCQYNIQSLGAAEAKRMSEVKNNEKPKDQRFDPRPGQRFQKLTYNPVLLTTNRFLIVEVCIEAIELAKYACILCTSKCYTYIFECSSHDEKHYNNG
jgi:hypothetical protein